MELANFEDNKTYEIWHVQFKIQTRKIYMLCIEFFLEMPCNDDPGGFAMFQELINEE